MELALTAALFILVAGAMTAAGVRLWARPKAAMERVTGTVVVQADKHVPGHPSLVFQSLVRKVGTALPVSPRDAGLLERRLIRAGLRAPGTARLVYGARFLLSLTLPLAAYLVAVGWASDSEKLWTIVLAAAGVGYIGPGWWVGWMARRRQRRIRRGLPDALDLLVICVESGLGLDQALMQSAKELEIAHPDISEEFTLVNLARSEE